MNGTVMNILQRLQTELERLDPQQDRDTLVWTHAFLAGLTHQIESRLPDLVTSATLLQSLRANLDSMLRENSGYLDSLQKTGRELDESDDSPVPVKLKPGPKGLSGGAAVRLPDSELPPN